MAKQGRQLGALTLARAVEMVMPFDRKMFFPDTTPEEWVPHEGWMKPGAMDPATATCCSRCRATSCGPRTTPS